MIDLSSQEMQATFKKLQRTTIITNVLMCLVSAGAVAIAIWGTATTKGKASWSEILFYILIAVIAAYFVAVLAWEFVLRRKHAKNMHAFIAENFFAKESMLQGGGDISFDIALAGDRLVVMRDNGEYIEFDLAPVKRYFSVCSYTVRLAKRFICDYYYLEAQRGGVSGVVLHDRVQRRERTRVYVEGGNPRHERKYSYFIRNGIIK